MPYPIARPADPTRAQLAPERLTGDDRRDVVKAVNAARRKFPGPAGVVLAREIDAYLTFGYRVDATSPIPQLIAELLGDTP
jgi:hypothetical protein